MSTPSSPLVVRDGASSRLGDLWAVGLAKVIDAFRVNAVVAGERQGRAVLEKRRKLLRTLLFPGGNLFLRLSRSRIHMFTSAAEWEAHELHGFELLYGPERVCGALEGGGLFVERLPGRSLRDLVIEGALSEAAMRGAGVELRRAHGLSSARCGGPWSHGDLHLGNVLYDAASDRAWLIDFETRHEVELPAVERHADDLLVLLLELVGRCEVFEPFASALLSSYGDAAVLEALRERLRCPRGWEAVLWSTRTHHLATGALPPILARLRAVLDGVAGP